jgi:hypothetical protein
MPSTASLSFDGVNDVCTAANHSDLNVTGDLTVELWFKTPSHNQSNELALIGRSADQGGNFPFNVRLKAFAERLEFNEIVGYATQTQQLSLSGTTANTWNHAAFTRSGRTVQGYLNGVAVGSPTVFTGSASGTAHAVTVGWGEYLGYFPGRLDEVRIWNVARTSGEISSYYDKKASGSETGLVALWHMDEGTGLAVEDDATGTDQDLSISGATWDTADFPTLTDAGGGAAATRLLLPFRSYAHLVVR